MQIAIDITTDMGSVDKLGIDTANIRQSPTPEVISECIKQKLSECLLTAGMTIRIEYSVQGAAPQDVATQRKNLMYYVQADSNPAQPFISAREAAQHLRDVAHLTFGQYEEALDALADQSVFRHLYAGVEYFIIPKEASSEKMRESARERLQRARVDIETARTGAQLAAARERATNFLCNYGEVLAEALQR